jgi:hypothetical protein
MATRTFRFCRVCGSPRGKSICPVRDLNAITELALSGTARQLEVKGVSLQLLRGSNNVTRQSTPYLELQSGLSANCKYTVYFSVEE